MLRHALPAFASLALSACAAGVTGSGVATLPEPAAAARPASAQVPALDHEDAEVRRRAASSLEALGEAALPDLERAMVEGAPGTARRAGRIREAILQRLEAVERAADDAAFAAEASRLAALPAGTWILVTGGRLAASGPVREAVLAEGEAVAPAARHRYLWRAGEPVGPRTAELGVLVAGDAGRPLGASLGGAPERLTALDGRGRVPFPGTLSSEWEDAAVAVSEDQARVLGLARFEIPGIVTLQSRLGAGVMARARRARVAVDGPAGGHLEVEAWILPPAPVVLGRERLRPGPPPVLPPGQSPPQGGNEP